MTPPPKANVERQNRISRLIQCGGQDESDDSGDCKEATLEAKHDGVAVPEDTQDVVGQTPAAELFVNESPEDDEPPVSDSQTIDEISDHALRKAVEHVGACFVNT